MEEWTMTKRQFEIKSKDHKDGHYRVVDVSGDKAWDDVLCVESHGNRRGFLTTVINHRKRTAEQACSDLLEQGAIEVAYDPENPKLRCP
jgi:hypothetical protein